MKPTTVIGLGAGSHGRVIADIISRTETFTLHAWLDQSSQLHGTSVSNAKVMGDDSLLAELHLSGISKAFIGVGSIGDSSLRCHIVSQALEAGFFFPVITDPTDVVLLVELPTISISSSRRQTYITTENRSKGTREAITNQIDSNTILRISNTITIS